MPELPELEVVQEVLNRRRPGQTITSAESIPPGAAIVVRYLTAVIISHRFSTVRMADRIAVLGDGQLLEIGTRTQLMASAGLYAELFNLQARGCR